MWQASTVCSRARKGSTASAPGWWQPPRWMQTGVGRRQGGRLDQGQQDQSGQMETQNLMKLKLQRGQPSRDHTPPKSRWRAAPCLGVPPEAGERGHRNHQCLVSDYHYEVCSCPHTHVVRLGRQWVQISWPPVSSSMVTWTTWTIPTTKWYAAVYLTVPSPYIIANNLRLPRAPTPNEIVSFLQRKALIVLFQRWFSVAAEETSVPGDLAAYLREVRKATPTLLAFLVNLADDNGNTVLHYSVSHCNYGVVSLLLETGDAELLRPEVSVYTQTLNFYFHPFRCMWR